jgi:hypothetical protein
METIQLHVLKLGARVQELTDRIKLTPCGRTFFLRHVSDTPPSSHL